MLQTHDLRKRNDYLLENCNVFAVKRTEVAACIADNMWHAVRLLKLQQGYEAPTPPK